MPRSLEPFPFYISANFPLRKYQVDPVVAKDKFDHGDINGIHMLGK